MGNRYFNSSQSFASSCFPRLEERALQVLDSMMEGGDYALLGGRGRYEVVGVSRSWDLSKISFKDDEIGLNNKF